MWIKTSLFRRVFAPESGTGWEAHAMAVHWDRGFALEQAGGDEDLLRELLMIFSGTLAANRQTIEEALTASDFPLVARAVHSIKGSASSLGFAEIAQMADVVENQARDGGGGQGSEFLARLRALEETLPRLA